MYYLLAAAFFIIIYFALAKLLSSLLKGCLVTAGVAVFVYFAYAFVTSSVKPVNILNKIIIDNYQIEVIEKPEEKEVLGTWERF
ncbi:hypothetical protein HN803_01730 [candidate division WWE3 bacterium]|jgi:hypothetical protein|nr:hypothetical protein [candidate division WWE3 bacterium]MBT7349491.1 hypothetical protein [candidate division WWE3 bacterium]